MNNGKILAFFAVVVAFLLLPKASTNATTGETEVSTVGGDLLNSVISTVRGLRNNNPGNIRKSGTAWQGMSAMQTDSAFVQFDSVEYGIRAMNKILDSYARRGVVTVQGIIATWAPPKENDTASYTNAVCADMGAAPWQQVTAEDRPALIAAIIKHENGINPYALATIEAGVSLA